MRRTLTSVIALGFAITASNAALAQDEEDADDMTMEFAEDQQRFTDAGFEGAQVMHNVEVARVTRDDETFFVVKGLDGGMGGMGMQQGQMDMQPGQLGDQAAQPGVGEQDQLATDTQPGMGEPDQLATDTQPGVGEQDQLATGTQPGMDQPGMDMAGWDARSLEEILDEAGIEDYEILDDVRVANVRMGEGMDAGDVIVFYGIDGEVDEDS